MAYETDRIYSLAGTGLVTRSGHIDVDPGSHMSLDREDPGPLHVEGGLRDDDFAVFLRLTGADNPEMPNTLRIGYLVTEVDSDTDGSGILVGKALLEANPNEWVSGRVENMWQVLHGAGVSIGDRFGLLSLEKYLLQRLYGSDTGAK